MKTLSNPLNTLKFATKRNLSTLSATGLVVGDFDVADADGFYSGAHVQNTGSDFNSSDWIASDTVGPPGTGTNTPEPASLGLLAVGGLGLLMRRRRSA